MHRRLDKMIIFTIFILSLARWTTSTPSAPYYEEQLAKEVIRYRQFIDPYSQTADASLDAASSWITQAVLQSLEYNVRYLLKLASNFYKQEYGRKIAESATNISRKIKIRRAVTEMQNQYERTMCSTVPRLLAFLYMFTNEPSGYVQLHRLHSIICFEMPAMVDQSSPEHINQSTYLVDEKKVKPLLDIKEEFKHCKTSTKWTVNEQNYGVMFVRKVLEYANGVDKKWLLTTPLYSEDSCRKIFGVTVVELYRERTDGKGAAKLDEETVNKLNEKLQQLNSKYLVSEMPVPDVVNHLVTWAFKTLMTHFGRNVHERLNNSDLPFERSDMNNMVHIELDSLCVWMSLVLVYLTDNCSDTDDIEVPFGLYLTLCGDWDGFLEVQCPGTLDENYERVCVMNAIADRLLVNFYRVTGSFYGYDDANGDVEASNPITASTYVFSVYKYLHDIYIELDDELPVWTVSDWLTGKHFLANQRQDLEHPPYALGEKTIILLENDDRPTAEVLLSEAHKLLLPWHSDARNVFAFHAALFSHADQTMKEFVNRHAAIVSLYLRHVKGSLNSMLSYPLYHTFGWYVECERRFYYFLDIPGPREPRGEWSVDDLLFANENLERTDNENFVGQNATTKSLTAENTAKLSTWAIRQFSNIKGLEDLDKFKSMLLTNCTNAVEYVNDIIRIAQVSKVTWKYAEYLQVDFCEQFVHGVLAQ